MKQKELSQKVSSLKIVAQFVSRWKARYITGLLLVAVFGYFTALVTGTFLGVMLDLAARGSTENVLWAAAQTMGAILLLLVLSLIGKYLFMGAAKNAVAELKRKLYLHMLALPYGKSAQKHSGDLLSRLDSNAQQCAVVLEQSAIRILTALISIVMGALTVSTIHWGIALSIFGVGVVMMTFNFFWVRRNGKTYEAEQKQYGKTLSTMGDLLAGTQLVRVYGEDTGLLQRFTAACNQLYVFSMQALKVNSVFWGMNQITAALTVASSVGLGILFWRMGEIQLSAIPLLLQMGLVVVQPMAMMVHNYDGMQRGLAGARRVYELFREEEETLSDEEMQRFSKTHIRAENLCFSYEEGKYALDHLSFMLESGKTYGIVGYSGSGKSTLLHLLMGMDAYEGNLSVNGREVCGIPVSLLRENIAYVPQECPLFNDSVMENIRLGKPGADDEAVIAAARAANAHGFITELENGYNTLMGENGVRLSGGQRQRISIARAILKDAPILLLDEVTAALDSVAEAHIQEALKPLMKGRTTIIIAHRLSTVFDADEILVLERGALVEQGTHIQLMERGGIYSRLYQLQAALGVVEA